MHPPASSRRTRVWTRLLAIVLIPVVGLAGFTARDSAERSHLARGADDLSHGVARVSELTPIALLVAREMYLASAAYAGAQFGLDVAETSQLIGMDLDAERAATAHDLDVWFDRLGPDDPALVFRRRLEAIRAGADSGELDTVTAGDELSSLSVDVTRAGLAAVEQVEDLALDLEGSGRVPRALAVLRATDEAALAVYEQVGSLARLFAGQLDLQEWPAADAQYLREFHTATAAVEARGADVQRIARGRVREAWTALRSDADVRRNETEMQEVAVAEGELPTDLGDLGGLFGRALHRLDRYFALSEQAAAEAAAQARTLGDAARDRLRWGIALTAALIASSLVLTALIARSIAAPLRRLAAGAGQVSAGDLDGVTLPAHGPREVASVSATLGEAVENLRVVESQLGVLAEGDVADAATVRVPGRLGDLLHDAVGRLSRSMQERDALGRRLEHEATHDALTGLPNRAAAAAELQRALARAQRSGTSVAVLYVDLDGFKHVNDHHGHDAGDTVLRAAASRLAAAARSGDLVSRIGGDEFLVVTEDAGQPDDLVHLGERLVEAVSQPVPIGIGVTRIGASIGIAVTADGQVDADALLRESDLAAYRAKAAGRGRAELFDDHLRAEVDARAELERALRTALDDDQLELHFQPVVDQHGGGVTSVEALLRWTRPDGPVPPGVFIPVAETSDLIIDIDRWVLARACEQLVSWRDDPGLGELSVAVNLSGRHLLSLTVVEDVRQAIEESGADADRLTVEITETVLLSKMPLVVEHLHRIRQLGVRVAIDDFGTGYTSLAHLRTLPVDVLKIDRSLVIAAGDAPDVHVLGLLVGTAHALGMRLVAEGVETEEQLANVRTLGCDQVQGYLYSRPRPAADLPTVMAALTRVLRAGAGAGEPAAATPTGRPAGLP